jgi:hypothetical protein
MKQIISFLGLFLALSAQVYSSEFKHFPTKLREVVKQGVSYKFFGPFDIQIASDSSSRKYRNTKLFTKIFSTKFHKLTIGQRDCFYLVLMGDSDCSGDDKTTRSKITKYLKTIDLIEEIRLIEKKYGKVASRDLLVKLLPLLDNSNGEIERRLIHNAKDQSNVFEDALANMDDAEKKRTGFLMTLGFNHNLGFFPAVGKAVTESFRSRGFVSEVLDSHPSASSYDNAQGIVNQLKEKMKDLDRVVLIGLSKASQEYSNLVIYFADQFTKEERDKLVLIANLSGVVRYSYFAKWLSETNGMIERMLRAQLRRRQTKEEYKILDGLYALAKDPWEGADHNKVKAAWSKLSFVNFVMMPGGEKGENLTENGTNPMVRFMQFLPKRHVKNGPHDTLVESAAELLPTQTKFEQTIVRVYGSHGLVTGVFLDGTPVSDDAYNMKEGKLADKVLAGSKQALDLFMRSFPEDQVNK